MSTLFEPVPHGDDWRFNAVVGGHEEDAVIATGFHELAAHGVRLLVERGPDDSLFVPIVYNFRHAFELVLKVAVRDAATVARNSQGYHGVVPDPDLEPDGIDKRLATVHSLGRLLDEVIELLARSDIEALLPEVVSTIRQLGDLDPSGQAFRYAQIKDKQKKLVPARPEQQLVDVRQLGQRLSRAFSWVADGLLSELDERLRVQQEMLRDDRGGTA